MEHVQQPAIEFLDSYTAEILSACPHDPADNHLLLVLRIFKAALQTQITRQRVSLQRLETFVTGSRMAATLLRRLLAWNASAFRNWRPGGPPANQQQRLASTLRWAEFELDRTIAMQEAFYPQHEKAFDRQRLEYRQLKVEAELE